MRRLLSALASLTLLTGCGAEQNKPKKKGTLHLNLPLDPPTLDPRKGSDFTSITLHYLLFEGLTRMTPYSNVDYGLAEDIEISQDKKTYIFHLRDSKWSNGSAITAYDFIQTWKDMLDPHFSCPNAHLLYPIKNAEKAKFGLVQDRKIGIYALDHKTLVVELEKPTPYFLEMISFCVFAPVNQHVAQKNQTWAEKIDDSYTCNGPYRIKNWQMGRSIELEKNPYYWDANNVLLENIHFSIITDKLTAYRMYQKDELDILGIPFTGIPSDAVPTLLDKGLLKASALPASTICCFNMESYPFNNINMRKAFAFAINRQEIIDNITQMNEEVGLNLIPKVLLEDQPTPFFADGDIERAREYFELALKELGATRESLQPLKLLHANTGIYPRIAQALQAQWSATFGIEIVLEGNEYKAFLDKLNQREFQISQCIWVTQYHDPMNILERFQSRRDNKNYPGYENPLYTKLLEESHFSETNEERLILLRKAISVLMEDMPLTPICHWNNMYLQKPYVKNLLLKPSGYFHLHKIFIDEI